jgi:hypothetical protein
MDERENTLERAADGDASETLHDPVEPGQEIAVATPLGDEPDPDRPDDDEEIGGGGNGRFITAIGAAVLLVGMFLAWYEVVRSNGYTVNTTGWQTFTHLRFVLLLGSVGCLVSVLLRQTRLVVLGRLAVGIVASVLVIRRIVSPPELKGSTVTAQLGIYVSLLGALGIAFGGLLGLGTASEEDEDAEREPEEELTDTDGERLSLAEGGDDDTEIVDADVVHGEPAGDARA